MSRVAQFAVEAQVEPVRCGFLSIDLVDEVAHSEFRCGCADGKRIDSLPARSQVLNAWKNDLSPGELGEVLLRHAPKGRSSPSGEVQPA